ncbi:serine hydrolase domain-containing protein [Pseudoalteromonas peptidolytica]|uniref:Beta-lactamase-related domain-containing protein n=1 Tax=Pseudoalteromonas peptidolytica F12-50-A1 TaxID=1315280 RepID=A0A8I0MVW2_9GAMM|nr:serine hydrolase [Pseudoalteromonas peptidolytica]MBE0346776.1 hypothetical protein [Pseudoalteromonas peptidolytica F12-50-A1]NLR13685.1 serine hydrolase [Pseudoalteromonas peptidolytica]
MRKIKGSTLFLPLLGTLLLISSSYSAHSKPTLTAEQSDPKAMAWMQGFPPKPDKRITQPDSNFFSFPKLRWSVCNMRALLPTESIKRQIAGYRPLEFDLLAGIDDVTFLPSGNDKELTWEQSLKANYTDGIIILHQGKVVYERYFGCLDQTQNHAVMSMTKSVTGLIAEMLIAKGKLDENLMVSSIIPELKNSAFGGATVRQVMDMTTALEYSENYADPKADIWQYAYAANPLPKPKGYEGPQGYFEYLQTIKASGEHGESFGYKTVNSDVLGWIISRVTGKKYNEVVSELLWQPLGMQQDADVTVDGLGTPFAGGGISASLRDMARLGLTMLNQGKVAGIQVIDKAAVGSIVAGGSTQAFEKAGFSTLPNGSYRSMWWHFHNQYGAYAARGVHGQTIYIAPKAEMVIVRFASHPSAGNSVIDPTALPAYAAVAEYLMSKNQ